MKTKWLISKWYVPVTEHNTILLKNQGQTNVAEINMKINLME